MADFRKWITALTMLVLFAGLAAAQSAGTGTAMSCSVVGYNPTLRGEGVTELVGDIVINCTGGTPGAPGTGIPTATIQLTMSNLVTSRILSGSISEATLLIDEPGTAIGNTDFNGYGAAATISSCNPSLSTGCPAFVNNVFGTSTTPIYGAGSSATGTTNAANAFFGTVNGNQITFNNIPILAPGTTGFSRTFRITNVRVSSGGAASGTVTANNIQIFGTAIPPLVLNTTSATVGTIVGPSMTPTVNNASSKAIPANAATSFAQCINPTLANVATLSFKEAFQTAFKTRAGSYTSYLTTTSAGSYNQNVPGTLYNIQSESGLIIPVTVGTGSSSTTTAAGLADSGTRFKAVFSGLPDGASIYVSQFNVTSFSTASATTGTLGPVGPGTTTVAQYTAGGATGVFTPATAPTGGFPTAGGNVQLIKLSGANPTAVWEVLNSNPNTSETFNFAVYISFAQSGNLPTVGGTPTVTLSYAPIDTTDTTTWIPRFTLSSGSTATPLLSITNCQTVLLFPYVVTAGGFETGIAISNTSLDPLGTTKSTGSCTLNFYGANAPATLPTSCVAGTPTCVGPLDGGQETAILASSVAQNFSGYVFAVCNFQYAHGFAYITNAASATQGSTTAGYLALVVNVPGTARGGAAPGGSNFTGEGLGQ